MKKSLAERFWAKVDHMGECWLWTGGKSHDGYGHYRTDFGVERAHRVSWWLHFGPIKSGLMVLHKCDIPACVNPDHLFLGTRADNATDREKKGRGGQVNGERNANAKLTAADVIAIRARAESSRSIGKEYGVSHAVVTSIRRRESWKHVQ